MWHAEDGRLYLVPSDGNIVALEAARDPDGWNLDNLKQMPRPVRQIIPAPGP
jgi:hypothetical protein